MNDSGFFWASTVKIENSLCDSLEEIAREVESFSNRDWRNLSELMHATSLKMKVALDMLNSMTTIHYSISIDVTTGKLQLLRDGQIIEKVGTVDDEDGTDREPTV